MSRSWFSNFQGAADWATGNRWDFDNLGRPSSVAEQHNNLSNVSNDNNDNNDGGYKTSWSDAFRAADNWNQGQKGGYMPGYMSKGPINWPTSGATKVGNNSTIYDPTASWWKDYQVYNPPQKQGGGIGGMIGNVAGTLIGGSVGGPLGAKVGGSIGGSIGGAIG